MVTYILVLLVTVGGQLESYELDHSLTLDDCAGMVDTVPIPSNGQLICYPDL